MIIMILVYSYITERGTPWLMQTRVGVHFLENAFSIFLDISFADSMIHIPNFSVSLELQSSSINRVNEEIHASLFDAMQRKALAARQHLRIGRIPWVMKHRP